MGGNVFKNDYNVKRLNKEDYLKIWEEVKELLLLFYSRDEIFLTKSVKEKTDFGDMDIIIKNSSKREELQNYLSILHPVNSNGEVFSFLYKSFQIDLIFTGDEYFNYSCKYYSWNDLGNLLGRSVKPLGLSHGHKGLYYPVKFKGKIVDKVLISRDYKDILNILELDATSFEEGFESYQSMFKFITSSPYFDPSLYYFENLNNKNRIRDKKRKVYNMFLNFISDHFPKNSKPLEISEEKLKNIFNINPLLMKTVNSIIQNEVDKDIISLKFNGNIVKELTKLEGPSLGKFMIFLKKSMSREFLLKSHAEEIKKEILKLYELKGNSL